MNDKVCFWHVGKHKSFPKLYFNTFGITPTSLISSLLMDMIKHSQIVISLQNLKKKKKKNSQEWSSFLTCRETAKFLQVGIVLFGGSDQTCPKYPK